MRCEKDKPSVTVGARKTAGPMDLSASAAPSSMKTREARCCAGGFGFLRVRACVVELRAQP